MEISIEEINTESSLYKQELEVRYEILRKPLGHGRDAVQFPFEKSSLHFVCKLDEKVIGCVLFYPER